MSYAQYIDLQCTSLANAPFAKLGRHMPFAMLVWPLLVNPPKGATSAPPNRLFKFAQLAFKTHPP